MGPPPTRYARSGDVSVAYQVSGEGPPDLVLAPGTVSHLDFGWDSPMRDFFERIGRFARLIRFDKRGTGLSDRPTEAATLEERTDDIRAVMDAAGSERAFLFGASEGGSMACLFAATYPERTLGLIVWGAQARWIKDHDYPWGYEPDEYERMVAELADGWPTEEYVRGWGAGTGAGADADVIEEMMRRMRAGASPAAAVALERMNGQIDIREILPTIQAPTLVLNRTGDPIAHVDAARDLAARVPGARFVAFPGDSHGMAGIADRVVAEIEEFATGTRQPAPTTRMLTTIVFVDLVGSTERAAELGDAAWRDLLAEHYRAAENELQAYGGREIDRAGDGLLAVFDGPTRAVRCARAIQASAQALDLGVRAGVHTGEVELDGTAIRGIAVHTAARVAAAAAPGEVLVTGTVKDLSAGSEIAFDDRGVHELKGIPEARRLYRAAL
jgi:class 3 adenylate cyclase